MPILIPLLILLILWVKYESRKTTRLSDASSKAFWQREQEARYIRTQNLDQLSFFQISKDTFPTPDPAVSADPELTEWLTKLAALEGQDMVNLSGYTNTELKLTFGTPKFKYLTECDEHCSDLFLLLDRIAGAYLRNNDPATAKRYLDFAIAHETDIAHSHEMYQQICEQTTI